MNVIVGTKFADSTEPKSAEDLLLGFRVSAEKRVAAKLERLREVTRHAADTVDAARSDYESVELYLAQIKSLAVSV